MHRIPDRNQQRQEYLRKKAATYSRVGNGSLLVVSLAPIGLTSLYCLVWLLFGLNPLTNDAVDYRYLVEMDLFSLGTHVDLAIKILLTIMVIGSVAGIRVGWRMTHPTAPIPYVP